MDPHYDAPCPTPEDASVWGLMFPATPEKGHAEPHAEDEWSADAPPTPFTTPNDGTTMGGSRLRAVRDWRRSA